MSDKGEKSSWLEPLPEEYTIEGDMTGRRMVLAALTVVVLAVFGGLIWYSYLEGRGKETVPVVHADKSVVKVKPDTPGGLQVPDQDKRVFSRITPMKNLDQLKKNERMGASAELPLARPEGKAIKNTVAKKVAPSSSPRPVAAPVVKSSPRPVAASVVKSAPPKVPLGNYLVQLGAFGRKNIAVKLWYKIQQKNRSLLGDLTLDIMMVDLGKKGVFYRLRAGMIADKLVAVKICAALKIKKQACIVVSK